MTFDIQKLIEAQAVEMFQAEVRVRLQYFNKKYQEDKDFHDVEYLNYLLSEMFKTLRKYKLIEADKED